MKNIKNKKSSKFTTEKNEIYIKYGKKNIPYTPIPANTKIIVFQEYAKNIPYIGVCSQAITEYAKQDTTFINTLKELCYNIIFSHHTSHIFIINYIDDDTHESLQIMIKHSNKSTGSHTFYIYTDTELDFPNNLEN